MTRCMGRVRSSKTCACMMWYMVAYLCKCPSVISWFLSILHVCISSYLSNQRRENNWLPQAMKAWERPWGTLEILRIMPCHACIIVMNTTVSGILNIRSLISRGMRCSDVLISSALHDKPEHRMIYRRRLRLVRPPLEACRSCVSRKAGHFIRSWPRNRSQHSQKQS
jgi:hypothetical protein